MAWLSYLKGQKVVRGKLWRLCSVSSRVLICREEKTELFCTLSICFLRARVSAAFNFLFSLLSLAKSSDRYSWTVFHSDEDFFTIYLVCFFSEDLLSYFNCLCSLTSWTFLNKMNYYFKDKFKLSPVIIGFFNLLTKCLVSTEKFSLISSNFLSK